MLWREWRNDWNATKQRGNVARMYDWSQIIYDAMHATERQYSHSTMLCNDCIGMLQRLTRAFRSNYVGLWIQFCSRTSIDLQLSQVPHKDIKVLQILVKRLKGFYQDLCHRSVFLRSSKVCLMYVIYWTELKWRFATFSSESWTRIVLRTNKYICQNDNCSLENSYHADRS